MKLGLCLVTITFVGSLVACIAAPDEEQATSNDELTAGDQDKACRLASPKKEKLCITVYDPVCGCDGKTYGNSCEASRVVTSWSSDACGAERTSEVPSISCRRPRPAKATACPAVYDPVCGCDGKTYGNACEAARVVTSWGPDACQ